MQLYSSRELNPNNKTKRACAHVGVEMRVQPDLSLDRSGLFVPDIWRFSDEAAESQFAPGRGLLIGLVLGSVLWLGIGLLAWWVLG